MSKHNKTVVSEWGIIRGLIASRAIMEENRVDLFPEIFNSPLTRFCVKVLMEYHDKGAHASYGNLHTAIEVAFPASPELLHEFKDHIRPAGAYVSTTAEFVKEHVKKLTDYAVNLKILDLLDSQKSAILAEDRTEYERLGQELMAVSNSFSATSLFTALEVFQKAHELSTARILSVRNGIMPDTGILTGIHAIDRHFFGFQAGDLVIIGGRPSQGKTALALQMATNMAQQGTRVGFISAEMSAIQLAHRAVCQRAELDQSHLRLGSLSNADIALMDSTYDDLKKSGFFISEAMHWPNIKREIRRMVRVHGCQIVFVDYLQLLTYESRMTNNDRVGKISTESKGLAKELSIPVVQLSQLNRSSEIRGGSKRPQLSDLRESGQIEQDADIVMFTHRPSYYGIDKDEQGVSLIDVMELLVYKNRNGAVGHIPIRWHGPTNKICDFPPAHPFGHGQRTPSQMAYPEQDDMPF